MRFSLEIEYPPDQMELNGRRLEARGKFEYADRVPVVYGVFERFLLARRGVDYLEFFSSPLAQAYHHLHNQKWAIENLDDDHCTAPRVVIYPNFENVINSGGMGADIVWSDREPPRCQPVIRTPEEAEQWEIHDEKSGLWAVAARWSQEMEAIAKDIHVRFNGKDIAVEVGRAGVSGEGPITVAVDLVGPDFYWWLCEYPRACHKLLETITHSIIGTETTFRRKYAVPQHSGFCVGDDAAQMLSPALFQEFGMPYSIAIYEALSGDGMGKGMHMCGRSDHLHSLLVEMGVNDFCGFGREVEPEVAAANLGGKMLLAGNVDPMLLLSGPRSAIREAADRCLRALAPCGGYLLQDGFNVAPATPLEHLSVLREAAEAYGLPQLAQARPGEREALARCAS